METVALVLICAGMVGMVVAIIMWRGLPVSRSAYERQRIDQARVQVGQIFAAAREKMERRAGYGDPFGIGKRGPW